MLRKTRPRPEPLPSGGMAMTASPGGGREARTSAAVTSVARRVRGRGCRDRVRGVHRPIRNIMSADWSVTCSEGDRVARKRNTKRWPVQDAKARFGELLEAQPHQRPPDRDPARSGDGCPRARRSMAPMGRRCHTPYSQGLVTRLLTACGDSRATTPRPAPAGIVRIGLSDVVSSRHERHLRIAQAAFAGRGGGLA
jgi:hypothetical protein